MAAVGLNPGMQVVAFKLQEGLMQGDVRARLQDAINDANRGTGSYAYYIDHDGDGETGDVVYSCNGDVRKASYEIGDQGGKAVCNIDMDNSVNVVPMTTYQEEADDDDHYASMEESLKADKLYSTLPLYERFISKGERDAATSEDFAGKGKSFPILKPGDVSAAVHAMGRAGSGNYGMAQLKANIIRIAKKKGWTSALPKAWRDDTSSSEAKRAKGKGLSLIESAATLETIVLKEARADYEIKLIAPGKGSSAFYPKEVLQRDGPKVFTAGTHVYLNHPTAAEESARPEGDIRNLAGVLATDAVYHEAHAKGPGLYARMKVFADHGTLVEEKAPHVGMSIRANGVAESGRQKDGLPILKELTSAESVDVVTRAGAGGMILTESARGAQTQETFEMTLKEAQEMVAAEVAKANAPLLERALRGDAREEAVRILETTRLPEPAKQRIIEASLKTLPRRDGELDVEAFRQIVVAEAKSMGELLAAVSGSGEVRGLGVSFASEPVDEEKLREAEKRARKDEKRLEEAERETFSELTGLRLVGKADAA